MHITRAGQGEGLQVVTDFVTIKASARETSGKILVMEVIVPPGGGPPVLHRHESSEVFYILEGEFELSTVVSGQLISALAKAGDTLAIPSMAWHNFKNIGTAPGKVLAIHSPTGLEKFAREIGTPINGTVQSPGVSAPPSESERERIMSIIEKYVEIMPIETIPTEYAPLTVILPGC